MNKVVLLHGPPSSGKYTLGCMLREKAGFKLLDSHMFHDFVRPFISKDFVSTSGEEYMRYAEMVMRLKSDVLQIIADFYPKNEKQLLAFTLFLKDRAMFEQIEAFSAKINAKFYPIELTASNDVLLSRVTAPERKIRGKIHTREKLSDVLAKSESLKVFHKNSLVINVGKHSVTEQFHAIAGHIGLSTC